MKTSAQWQSRNSPEHSGTDLRANLENKIEFVKLMTRQRLTLVTSRFVTSRNLPALGAQTLRIHISDASSTTQLHLRVMNAIVSQWVSRNSCKFGDELGKYF